MDRADLAQVAEANDYVKKSLYQQTQKAQEALHRYSESSNTDKEELVTLRRQKKLLVSEVVMLRNQLSEYSSSSKDFDRVKNELEVQQVEWNNLLDQILREAESIRSQLGV